MTDQHPHDPQALLQQAYLAYQQQQWPEQEALCRRILTLCPEQAEALQLLSVALNVQNKRPEGLVYMRQAVRLAPDNAGFRFNLAVCLQEMGSTQEADLHYQACLRLNPDHADALWNYGESLRLAEYFDLALACFNRLVALNRHYPGLDHRMAVCEGALGLYAQARDHFRRARQDKALPPEQTAMSPWEQALMELTIKNFPEGWSLYRHRFASKGLNKVYCHDFGLPWWEGQPLAQQRLLVHGEQGLGDEMMFASAIPTLLNQLRASGSQLVLAVKPALVRLLAHSFPEALVVPHESGGAIAPHLQADWQCAIGDLPRLCQLDMAQFQPAAYLRADPARTAHYHHQLEVLRPGVHHTFKVGLMWGSAPNVGLGKHALWAQQRSIAVAMLEPLAQVPGVSFVSLQNAERGAEAALAPRLALIDLSQAQTDFFETAALIANMDLVLSVDTSVGHLAGAMGWPTWQPLMKRADWRHTQDASSSYWYPNVCYIRQSIAGNWFDVVEQLRQRLANAVAVGSAHQPQGAPVNGAVATGC